MVYWWIFLVTLFSVGIAQKNCGRPKIDFPAPVFRPGDNLSAEGCGIWNKGNRGQIPPWFVVIRTPKGSCAGALISPTSVLTYNCDKAEDFADSEVNVTEWKVHLGKCSYINDAKCFKYDSGNVLQIENVTKVNAPGNPMTLHIWKIKEAKLKENYISPICLYNKGSQHDVKRMAQYKIFSQWNGISYLAELVDEFGPCLEQSVKFKTCDKVHENFLCTSLSDFDNWKPYLIYQEQNRHFLRALVVEDIFRNGLFYYDLVPLLDQIVSASGDIPLMPKIPKNE